MTTHIPEPEPCKNCAEFVHYAPPSGQRDPYGMHTMWRHVKTDSISCKYTGGQRHSAQPVSTCPKCSRRGTLIIEDTNWGINTDCTSCGYHSYFSLGD